MSLVDFMHAMPPASDMRRATQTGPKSTPQGDGTRSWVGPGGIEWTTTLVGLCLFTFAIVTYYLPIAQFGIGIGVFGVLVGGRARVPAPVWWFGAFIFWATVSSFASPHSEIAREQVLERLKVLLAMLVAINALRSEGQVRMYLLFFLVCVVAFPVRGALINFFVVGYHPFGRAIWNFIYSNPNDLAALLLIALGVAIGWLLSPPHRIVKTACAATCTGLLLLVILLTQSRGAFIGMIVGLGLPLIWLGRRRPLVLVPAVLAGIVISLAVPDDVWTRLSGIEKLTSASTIVEADPEGSAEQRFEIQKTALRIVLDHPLFGVGLGAYPIANARYAPELGARDTHNTYLNLAAEVGLPGLMLWFAMCWSVMRYAYRCRQANPTAALAGRQAWIERALFGFFIAAIFGSYAALTFPYLMLAVVWASAAMSCSGVVVQDARTRGHRE